MEALIVIDSKIPIDKVVTDNKARDLGKLRAFSIKYALILLNKKVVFSPKSIKIRKFQFYKYCPDLGSYLVATLPSLKVDNLSHFSFLMFSFSSKLGQ